jgi:outer membrane receptor protein involved in Fe transport
MTDKTRMVATRAGTIASVIAALLASSAHAQGLTFDIPAGDLKSALDAYIKQTGQQIVFRGDDLKGVRSHGVHGQMNRDQALDALLANTGLELRRDASGAVVVIPSRGKAGGAATGMGAPDTQDARKNSSPEASTEGPRRPFDATVAILGEVVVTAQKRAQRSQSVPISLVALTGETLENWGVQDVQSLGTTVAGLDIVNVQPGSNSFSMRGVANLSGSIESNSVVGYYVDEIPVSASGQGPEFALWDLERVEVLRGPQGTLFGEGSMAGTIRVITAKPNLTSFGGRVDSSLSTTASGGNNGSLRAMLNAPLVTDKLALRLLAGFIDDAGWIDVPDLNRKDVNTRRQQDYRGVLRWKPADAMTVDLSYMREQLKLGSEFTATSPGVLDPRAELPVAGPVGNLAPTDTTTQNSNLTLTYDFGPATLVAATSYFDYRSDWLIDLTPFVPLFFGPDTGGSSVNPPHATSRLWAQEVRLASNGKGRLQWTVGAFGKKSDRLDERNFTFYLEHLFGVPGLDLTDVSSTRDTSNAKSYSVFGDLDYQFAPHWSAQLGIRYYADSRDYDFEQLTSSAVFGTTAGATLHAHGKDSDVSPKVSVSWKPTDTMQLFARAAKGFRSGGTNGDSERSSLVPADYSAEELWSYEIGAKTNVSPGLIANFGLYYNNWTNLQLPFITPDGLFPFTANAGRARSMGGEMELQAQLPIDGLTASLGAAYADSEIRDEVQNALGQVVASKGARIPNSPKFSGTLALGYRKSIADGLVAVVRSKWSHRGSTFSDPNNSAPLANDASDTAFLSVGVEGARWGVDLYGDNLFNDKSSTFRYNRVVAAPLYWTSYVHPRVLGLHARMQF